MDFRKLARSLPQIETGHNASDADPVSLSELPPNILDALIPGYSIISRYALAIFGLDISLFVSVAVVGFALFKASQILLRLVTDGFRWTFMSCVYVDEGDDLYDMLMDWLTTNHMRVSRRAVKAKTQYGMNQQMDADASNSLSEAGLFDYHMYSSRTPPQYQPYYGRNFFWFNGRPFFFSINEKTRKTQNISLRLGGGAPEEKVIQIECIGRSNQPIRELLREAKVWKLHRQKNHTTIRHPTPKDRAKFGGSWSRTFNRPSRPMSTVILDSEQKEMIIRDMNEYLHPASVKWYAARGIPYRRGYLFHGPPGTGKTSLSFALAGIFGLDIYCISLQEPTLTESDLMALFNSLQRRCIVLLEDVDAAGLTRDEQSDSAEDESGETDASKKDEKKGGEGEKEKAKDETPKTDKDETAAAKKVDEFTLKDLALAFKEVMAPQSPKAGGEKSKAVKGPPAREAGATTGISLSGLLNAIDGVASSEGRVLIMTTNHPEKLDDALVRPGRIDRRVGFTLASREQIVELFMRMYSVSDSVFVPEVQITANGDDVKATSNGHVAEKDQVKPRERKSLEAKMKLDVDFLSKEDLEELAEAFAERVPDDTFTPAEIQNHLIKYKKEPGTALGKVEEWKAEVAAAKKKNKDGQKKAGEDKKGDKTASE